MRIGAHTIVWLTLAICACGNPNQNLFPFCSDGNLDADEICDDGNSASGDGCRADCQKIEVCGDGIIDFGEGCDDANNDDGDGCRNTCQLAFCGDGILDAGEECDDGNFQNTDECTTSCTVSTCNNNQIDSGEICFASAVNFPTGLTPFGSAAGDVNGDGFLDIITANVGTQSVGILFGNGDGSFSLPQEITLENSPFGIIIADLDNDLNLDIATANNLVDKQGNIVASSVSVLLNDGTGQFVLSDTFELSGLLSLNLTAADFDNDGSLDLATGHLFTSNVSILFNDGSAGFADQNLLEIPAEFFILPSQPAIVEAGDLDGDDIPDIFLADAGSISARILFNDGTGAFSIESAVGTGFGQFFGTLGDLDGDDDLDAVYVNPGGTISRLENPGDGVFDKIILGFAQTPFSATIADISNDTIPDVVVTGSGIFSETPRDQIQLFRQNSDGILDPQGTLTVGVGANSILVEDLNGDSLSDIITVNFNDNNISVLLGTP